jgi:uncharacterized repeat protein (TIGR04076 family)
MSKLKVTVLKTTLNQDFAEAYCSDEVGLCPFFSEGQEFIVEYGRPEDFCTWAWNDLRKFAKTLSCGGDFSGWSKNPRSLIRCCTHGVRPVVFNLEWLSD